MLTIIVLGLVDKCTGVSAGSGQVCALQSVVRLAEKRFQFKNAKTDYAVEEPPPKWRFGLMSKCAIRIEL